MMDVAAAIVKDVCLAVIGDMRLGKDTFRNAHLGNYSFEESDSSDPVILKMTAQSVTIDSFTCWVVNIGWSRNPFG
jgi:hypothetical protein